MSVGAPDNREEYNLYWQDGVTVFLAKDFPPDPPNIILQLKSNAYPPRLIASRRRQEVLQSEAGAGNWVIIKPP